MKCACECHKEKNEEEKADFEVISLRDGVHYRLCVTCYYNKCLDWIRKVQRQQVIDLVNEIGFGLN